MADEIRTTRPWDKLSDETKESFGNFMQQLDRNVKDNQAKSSTASSANGLEAARSETLVGAPLLRQKDGRVQQGWRRGNGKMVWFDVPQVSEDAPDAE